MKSQHCAGTVCPPERGSGIELVLPMVPALLGLGRLRATGAACQRPPNRERRSRRSGAKSETRLTRALLPVRSCAVSRAVSSRIRDVASAASR
jgi:hypothetical protein